MHTYRITPLSLWNALSNGIAVSDVLTGLEQYSKFPLSAAVRTEIKPKDNKSTNVPLYVINVLSNILKKKTQNNTLSRIREKVLLFESTLSHLQLFLLYRLF